MTILDSSAVTQISADPRVAPDWARHLIIYELNPRTFTSPNGDGDGSGSGTFNSLIEQLPYLAELGVNAIWLAGYCAASQHFYGVTSVYSCVDPSAIDPALGGEVEFRTLVECAHALGIRILLDVISHGVVIDSPLVASHPDWFSGSSWGMADYNYSHPDFRRWWVGVWTTWALDFGVDGFRVDVDLADESIWDEIVSGLRSLGKDVVVFPENGRFHFSQTDWFPQTDKVRETAHREFGRAPTGLAAVQISCHDNGWLGLPGNHYSVRGSRARLAYSGLLAPRIPIFLAGEEFDAVPRFVRGLRQGLYGTGPAGGWMYGSRIDWQSMLDPHHAAMLDDTRTMLRIRREYQRVINGDLTGRVFDIVPNDGALRYIPYAMAIPGEVAIIVLANDSNSDVATELWLPVSDFGFENEELRVKDLIDSDEIEIRDGIIRVLVRADGTHRGGYRVLSVTPATVAEVDETIR